MQKRQTAQQGVNSKRPGSLILATCLKTKERQCQQEMLAWISEVSDAYIHHHMTSLFMPSKAVFAFASCVCVCACMCPFDWSDC